MAEALEPDAVASYTSGCLVLFVICKAILYFAYIFSFMPCGIFVTSQFCRIQALVEPDIYEHEVIESFFTGFR